MNALLDRAGTALATWLSEPVHVHGTAPAVAPGHLINCLKPGDVLLVDGNSRISSGIKYLTQSTWSHAALFTGFDALRRAGRDSSHCLVEANIVEGVRSVGIEEFSSLHTRICRPSGLREQDRQRLIQHMIQRLGHRYDLRNLVDLMRYLLPTPPVPLRWRRRMISLGSGDPTRAICSTLIAQAFQSIRYPILPIVEQRVTERPDCPACIQEIMRIRHHSLFVPGDFDISPYFEVIKPTLANSFNYTGIRWQDLPDLQGNPEDHDARSSLSF